MHVQRWKWAKIQNATEKKIGSDIVALQQGINDHL